MLSCFIHLLKEREFLSITTYIDVTDHCDRLTLFSAQSTRRAKGDVITSFLA